MTSSRPSASRLLSSCWQYNLLCLSSRINTTFSQCAHIFMCEGHVSRAACGISAHNDTSPHWISALYFRIISRLDHVRYVLGPELKYTSEETSIILVGGTFYQHHITALNVLLTALLCGPQFNRQSYMSADGPTNEEGTTAWLQVQRVNPSSH